MNQVPTTNTTLSLLAQASKDIVKRRFVYNLFAFALVLVTGILILFYAVDVERRLNVALFFGGLELLLILLAIINFNNRNLQHYGYRTFNRVFYDIIGKLFFLTVIIKVIVNVFSLLNPYRRLDQRVESAGKILFESALDVGITLPAVYQSFKSAEIVEEYFRVLKQAPSLPQ